MKVLRTALAAAAVLAMMASAQAEDFMSVCEIYAAAQAMGERWQATVETPRGAVNIDAPLVVPQVEALPVIAMTPRKPLDEQTVLEMDATYPRRERDQLSYKNVAWAGDVYDVFLGNEIPELGILGWDAVDGANVEHGRFAGEGKVTANPDTYHISWTLADDEPLVRGSETTLEQAVAISEDALATFYPGLEISLQPMRVILHGSALSDAPGDKRGYYWLELEQVVGGVPLLGAIADQDSAALETGQLDYREQMRREDEKMSYLPRKYALDTYSQTRVMNEQDWWVIGNMYAPGDVVIPDVPLAPLETVLTHVQEAVASGELREVHAVRLGYMLYHNPGEAVSYAIPRWEVLGTFVEKQYAERYEQRAGQEEEWMFQVSIPQDAQTGELILLPILPEDMRAAFGVPELVTWDDVK